MFNSFDRSVENRQEALEIARLQDEKNEADYRDYQNYLGRLVEDNLIPEDETDPSGGYDEGEFARFQDCDEYDPSDEGFESGINYDEYPEFDE